MAFAPRAVARFAEAFAVSPTAMVPAARAFAPSPRAAAEVVPSPVAVLPRPIATSAMLVALERPPTAMLSTPFAWALPAGSAPMATPPDAEAFAPTPRAVA